MRSRLARDCDSVHLVKEPSIDAQGAQLRARHVLQAVSTRRIRLGRTDQYVDGVGAQEYDRNSAICVALLYWRRTSGIFASRSAGAEVYVTVADASLVKYQVQASGVALRNLNDFNPSALGCCYNNFIDTTTQVGRHIFAAMMVAAAQGKPFIFGVPYGYAAGPVTQCGQW
jgi:hypothetical protein